MVFIRIILFLILIGVIAFFGFVFFLFSGASSFRRSMRNNNQSTQGYSTSRSSQSYYASQNSKKDKYSRRYDGPTAKRTYTNSSEKYSDSSSDCSDESSNNYAYSQTQNRTSNSSTSQHDVVEVPLLEVSDVSNDK